MTSAFFRACSSSGEHMLEPLERAASGWGASQMRGMAVSGALARAVEEAVLSLGRIELRPVRWTVDLMRPAAMEASSAVVRVLREGRRLCLVEAVLEQCARPVARATALFLQASVCPDGETRPDGGHHEPPPPGLRPASSDVRLYRSEGTGWTADAAEHQSDARKQIWQWGIPVVEGETLSAFQLAASVADIANTVTNWGSAGLTYINADVTLQLARLPRGDAMGVAAVERLQHDGISVGTTAVYDRDGVFGSATVSALANGAHTVDVSSRAAALAAETAARTARPGR